MLLRCTGAVDRNRWFTDRWNIHHARMGDAAGCFCSRRLWAIRVRRSGPSSCGPTDGRACLPSAGAINHIGCHLGQGSGHILLDTSGSWIAVRCLCGWRCCHVGRINV